MLARILETINKNAFLIILALLLSFFSFQLGRLSGPSSGEPIKIQNAAIKEIFNEEVFGPVNEGGGEGEDLKIDFRVVVSKNSNKYHFLWCSGAKLIKEENKIYFNTEAEAISAGYTLAGNCSK